MEGLIEGTFSGGFVGPDGKFKETKRINFIDGSENDPMNTRLEDSDPFPFGKYKGKRMDEVPADYLYWVESQPWSKEWPLILDYINRNRTVLDKELEEFSDE